MCNRECLRGNTEFVRYNNFPVFGAFVHFTENAHNIILIRKLYQMMSQ